MFSFSSRAAADATSQKEALETKLKRVTDAAAGMNEATAVSIEKKYETALKLWKARKRKVWRSSHLLHAANGLETLMCLCFIFL